MYSDSYAIVTGSRRGVGKAIAEHFLNMDAKVIGLSQGVGSIEHPNYIHMQLDISKPGSVTTCFDAIKKITPSIDIVINNAAVLTSQYAMIMPISAAELMLTTNLLGPFMVMREASKMMRKAKWGRIINISSMAVSLEPIGDSMYAATKAGLTTLSNVMAKELAPMNITCNTLAISAIETDMLDQLPREKVEKIIFELPIKRFANIGDILNVIDFFASKNSSCITAQTIYLNGIN